MGLSEDFFAMFEHDMDELYNKGALPRELMYAHEASKITKACHGNLSILKGILEEFNPKSIPTTNDIVLFKNLLSTVIIQACLLYDSAEGLKKKYPDLLNPEGGDS